MCAWGHFLQFNAGVTGGGDGIFAFSYDNWIARCHFSHSVGKEME